MSLVPRCTHRVRWSQHTHIALSQKSAEVFEIEGLKINENQDMGWHPPVHSRIGWGENCCRVAML